MNRLSIAAIAAVLALVSCQPSHNPPSTLEPGDYPFHWTVAHKGPRQGSMEPYIHDREQTAVQLIVAIPYGLLEAGMVVEADYGGKTNLLHGLVAKMEDGRWITGGTANPQRDIGAMSEKEYRGVWFLNGHPVIVQFRP